MESNVTVDSTPELSGLSRILVEAGNRYGHGFVEDSASLTVGFLLVTVPCLLLTSFFMMADKEAWLEKYRIQPGKFVDPELNRKAVRVQLIRLFIVHPIFIYFCLTPIYKYRNMYLFAELPSFGAFVVQFILSMIINDTIFYWLHRAFHANPILYKYLHKQHHEFTTCSSSAALYGNLLGECLSIDIPAVAGGIILGNHMLVHNLYLGYRVLEGTEHHSGFALPYYASLSHTIPSIMPGADMHDFHHSHNSGCFGTSFYFWDWIMKTDVAYKTYKRQQKKID